MDIFTRIRCFYETYNWHQKAFFSFNDLSLQVFIRTFGHLSCLKLSDFLKSNEILEKEMFKTEISGLNW